MKSNKELEETAKSIVVEYKKSKKLRSSFFNNVEKQESLYAFIPGVKSRTLVLPGDIFVSDINYLNVLKNVAKEFSKKNLPLLSVFKIVFKNDIALVSMVNSSFDYYFNIFEFNKNKINTKNKIKKTWVTVREAKRNKEFDKDLLDIFYAYRADNLELRN